MRNDALGFGRTGWFLPRLVGKHVVVCSLVGGDKLWLGDGVAVLVVCVGEGAALCGGAASECGTADGPEGLCVCVCV